MNLSYKLEVMMFIYFMKKGGYVIVNAQEQMEFCFTTDMFVIK
jgi:hypothetical protein